jgi:hypothetical protein
MLHDVVTFIAAVAADLLLPLMTAAFIVAALTRALIYHTVKRELWFVREFEKRVNTEFEEGKLPKPMSFFRFTKKIMEKTFYECFELRSKYMRRKPDHVMSLTDRLFLVEGGSARIVGDSLRRLRTLKFRAETPEELHRIAKAVFSQNPAFSKILAIVPIKAVNDVINILPGMFVIGGIFGTFLGIMKGLPALSGMNLEDMDATKKVMDGFLFVVAHSMSTSAMGIILCVSMTMFNTLMSPEDVFSNVVNRFTHSLEDIWARSDDNTVPSEEDLQTDPNRDPLEIAAEEAVNRQLFHFVTNAEPGKGQKVEKPAPEEKKAA